MYIFRICCLSFSYSSLFRWVQKVIAEKLNAISLVAEIRITNFTIKTLGTRVRIQKLGTRTAAIKTTEDNAEHVHTKRLQMHRIQLAFLRHRTLTVAESTAPAKRSVPRQTTTAGGGKQRRQPPAHSAADDDDADEVSCAGTQIRTDPEWLQQSHAPARTNYCWCAVHSAILSGGRSSRPLSTSPDPACPAPADRRCRSTADPPRSRRRRSRMQTRSKAADDDQPVHTRRRLSLASRSTTTPQPYHTSPEIPRSEPAARNLAGIQGDAKSDVWSRNPVSNPRPRLLGNHTHVGQTPHPRYNTSNKYISFLTTSCAKNDARFFTDATNHATFITLIKIYVNC